jgi:hypothetical protein
MKPPTPKAVYLIEAEPSDVCFLDEVLYWVAFQRLPYGWGDHEGDDFRSWAMPGYEVDCSTCRIADDECERVGLPQDPRNSFDWAFGVKLDDDLDTIISRAVEKAEGNDAIREARDEAIKLRRELDGWIPQYRKAIELPAAKIYVALKERKLSAQGILLPDVDVKKAFAKESSDLSSAKNVEIPRGLWSLEQIFWEKSAARNETEHYCQIFCQTQEVLQIFPLNSLMQGVQVSGVERFGSFFILNDPALAPARRPIRRSQNQGRGRPQKYAWDDFHLEVACIFQRNGMPDKKEAAIELLQKWFVDRTGKSPSRSMIGEKLTPYYQRLVKNSGRKLSSGITV